MKKVTFAIAILTLSSTALAQQDTPRAADDCHTTLKTGSGIHFTKVCISSTGNITSYESPAGVEHVRIVDPVEGFRVCREDGWAAAWDTGSDDSGYDQGRVISQPNGPNTLPLRITTNTFNGLRISQDFFFRTLAYGPAELHIQFKVTNTGTQAIPAVSIQRFFDGDVNGDIADDRGYATANTVALTDPNGTSRGLSLSAAILDKQHSTDAIPYDTLLLHAQSGEASDCSSGGDFPRTEQGPADLAGLVNYFVGDLLPGRTKTVGFIYRRF